MNLRFYEAVLQLESLTNPDVSYHNGDQISSVHYNRLSLGHRLVIREEGRTGAKIF